MPLLVYTFVPFQTRRMLPVWLFFVTRFGLRVLRAAFGALGLDERRAFFAAFRVARRAARFALLGFEALRVATVLTAIVVLG